MNMNAICAKSVLISAKKREKNLSKWFQTGELIITLESFGQISAEDMFKKSIETLEKDLARDFKENF